MGYWIGSPFVRQGHMTAALTALVVALVARAALTPWLGDTLPFITVFGASAAATSRGSVVAVKRRRWPFQRPSWARQ